MNLASALKKAASEEDHITLALVGKNLYEESGEGTHSKTHPRLLIEAHEALRQKTYLSCAPIKFLSVDPSKLLPETHQLIRVQQSLYGGESYGDVLGIFYAQELAATPMLQLIWEVIFCSCFENDPEKDSFELEYPYFAIHLSGVEQRHGSDAWACLAQYLSNPGFCSCVHRSVKLFWDVQANYFEGLSRTIEESRIDTKSGKRDANKAVECRLEAVHHGGDM